jgi:sugar fermentation stimulation protein A
MEELLGPGARLLVRKVPRVGRKTGLDVVGILHEGLRISLDTRIPNKLIREGLRRSYIPEFRGYDRIVTEFCGETQGSTSFSPTGGPIAYLR